MIMRSNLRVANIVANKCKEADHRVVCGMVAFYTDKYRNNTNPSKQKQRLDIISTRTALHSEYEVPLFTQSKGRTVAQQFNKKLNDRRETTSCAASFETLSTPALPSEKSHLER